jgi:predicted Zn-dependent peptidase
MSEPRSAREPERTVFDSGLTLVAEPMADRRSASIGVWLRAGARDEPGALMGVTHFLEHMLFKGTATRSAFDIAQALESRGGHLDAFTTREYVCYYARCLEEHADLALEVLADIVGHSVLPDEEIEREKNVVREEIQSYEDNPEEKAHDVLAEAVWGADPLGWPILGTLESLEALTAPEIRGFYRGRYRPPSLVVAAAGSIDAAHLAERAQALFDQPRGEPLRLAPTPEAQPVSVVYVPRDVTQLYLALGRPGVPQFDDRRYALAVLNAIVGGGMSSRLFQSVRESAGLAYSIYSSVDFLRDTGVKTIALGVRPERAAEALARVARELTRFVVDGPSEEELESGRSQLKGSMILGQESVSNHMTHLAMDEIYYGRHWPLDAHLARVARVDRDAVMELAREFLRPETFTLVALGPVGAEDDVKRAWPPAAAGA